MRVAVRDFFVGDMKRQRVSVLDRADPGTRGVKTWIAVLPAHNRAASRRRRSFRATSGGKSLYSMICVTPSTSTATPIRSAAERLATTFTDMSQPSSA